MGKTWGVFFKCRVYQQSGPKTLFWLKRGDNQPPSHRIFFKAIKKGAPHVPPSLQLSIVTEARSPHPNSEWWIGRSRLGGERHDIKVEYPIILVASMVWLVYLYLTWKPMKINHSCRWIYRSSQWIPWVCEGWAEFLFFCIKICGNSSNQTVDRIFRVKPKRHLSDSNWS